MSGVYTVVVTDAHLCTASASTNTITVNPGLVVSASSNSPVCAGGTLNLHSSSTGGTSPFTYSWSATSYTSSVQDPSRSGANSFMAGLYSVTITDNKGCSGTASTNVVINPATTISVTSNSQVCVGNTLTLQATPSSGTSPFTYVWSGSASFSSSISNPSRTNAQLSYAGTYNVTATDVNGCSGTGSTSVVINPLPSVTAGSSSVGYCVNSTIQLNSTPSGGTPPYATYNWSGPSAYSSNQQNPSILNATTAMGGSYSVTLTDSKSCSATSSVLISVYTNPVVSAGSNQTSCSGEPVVLGGNPTASGGYPPYNFAWSNGAASTANPTVNPISSTTYTVTVTDNHSCSATASSTITINAKPTANAGSDQTIPSCSLIGTTIGGSPTASGGTAPYNYSWAPAAGLSSASAANPNVTGIGTTTSYSVIVTDLNGCTASDLVIVNVTGSSLALNVTENGPSTWCASGSSNVTLTANATGGSTPYTYSWVGSNLSSANSASTIANPSVSGSYLYTCVVTDATGCQAGDTTSTVVHPKPSADAGASNYNICNGESITIGGNPTAQGGTSPFTYGWSGGAASVANPTVSPNSTSVYIVTVTDANSCTATATSNVTVRFNPVADAGADVNLPGCSPTGIQIGGSPTASAGGGAPYTYAWSPSAGLSSTSVANPVVQGITSDRTYTVTVSDVNGCSSSDQIIIHVISNTPSVNISSGSTPAWCAGSGGSVNLSANVTGGTGPMAYAWSGSNLSPLNAQTATANPNTANSYTYYVTVTDDFNCTATASKVVTVNSNPSANAGSDNYMICNGQSVTIGGNPTVSGGTFPYNYAWSGGASPLANPVVNPSSTITYILTVSDANNCSATANSTVTVRINPIADAGADKTMPGCTPTGLQIGGSPTASGGGGAPYAYAWSPSTGLTSISAANPSVAGISSDNTYTVVVTDVNGCTASDQMVMHVISNTPSVHITASGSTAWCSGSNSSVNLTANVTGGTNPLTYSWSGTNINPVNSQVATVYPNTAAIYNYVVTVTDGYNCTATATKTVSVNANPVVNAGASIHNICAGVNVTIGGNPTATGGVPPYTYSWNSGANAVANPVVTPLTSTTYIVTVTDSVGCSAAASTTVLVRPTVIVNAGLDKTIFSCVNACTLLGTSPTGSGGSGALTYAWSPATGLNSAIIANPTACGLSGNTFYTVTVTDTSGCSATDQILITAIPGTLTAEAGSGGALCLNNGDSVMLGGYPTAVGGTPPYIYTWSPTVGLNLTNQANPDAFPIVTTLYSLTITDALGCTSTDTSRVRVYPVMTANAGNDTTVCEGSPVALGANPTASGGSGNGYTYVWSPTTNVSGITLSNPTATPFTSIAYSVTATDGNGCTATDHMIINVRPNPLAQTGSDKSITICPLDNITIGGSPAATGGNPPYTYSWSPGVGLSSTTVSNPVVHGIGSNQTYILTVTDSYGCSSADNVVVNVVPSTLQAYQASTHSVCSGPNACVQLGGLPTAVGGTTPYTYIWSNTGSLSNPASSNPIACPSTNATYGLTITDSKGCTVTSSESVIIKQSPVANAGNDTAICLGQSLVLGGNPTASGGTGSGYNYYWIPTVGINNSLVANPVSNTTSTTTYTISVNDPNGCSASDDIVVVVRTVPVVDAGPDKNISVCSNDTIFLGNVPLVNSGGTAPYTYHWTPASGLSSATVTNPLLSGITQTTSYQVIVSDTYGCTGNDNVMVNVYQQTLQAEAGNANVICAAAGTPVTVGGFPAATGGTPPYVYSWSPAAGLSSTSTPNPIATVSSTTMFYLSVTDSKGCVSVDSVKVTQHPSPVANAGADTALCSGFGKILGGNPTANGGTGTYQYSWSPTTGLSANNTSNPSAYPLVTTTYLVLITDSNGCQAADAVTIIIYPNPVADAGADKTITVCVGDSVQIGGSPSGSGGAGGFTYSWSPVNGLSSVSDANPYVKGISTTSLYALTVMDANGCSAADALVVNVNPSNLSADAGNDINICFGGNTIVTLGGNPTPTGGTAPYIFAWSPSQSLNSTSVSNPFATPLVTTKYIVSVTDSKGCSATDSVVVTVKASPIVNAGADVEVCQGGEVRLGSNPTASGSLAPYTYSWSPSIGINNTSASNPLATLNVSTVYTVVVTDANGCTNSDVVSITVHQNPVADAGADKTLVGCSADSVMIGGSPSASGGTSPYTYLWSPTAGVSATDVANPYVSHLGSSTTYTLVVFDQYECSATDQVRVSISNSTLFAEAGNNITVCQGAFAPVVLGGSPTVTGGTPSYTYSWSPSAGLSSTSVANPAASPTQSTFYTVVITDGAGCIATDTVRFTINPKPVVNAGMNDTICHGSCVTLGGNPTANGITGPFTYNWQPTLNLNDPSLSNPVACPVGTITYSVTATDQFGCSNSSSITIKINANPIADAGADQTLEGCKNACVTIGGSPSGSNGMAPYTYSWSPTTSMNNPTLSNPTICDGKGSHIYTLTVTDANGCSATDQMNLQTITSNLTADAGPDKTVCAGQTNCIIIGGTPAVMGGTPPFIINWSPVSSFCTSNFISNPSVNPSYSTTYVMLVKDAKGCESADSMKVIANPAVTVIVEPDTTLCAGTTGTLGGKPSTGSGGTAPYTYNWSPTLGLTNPGSGNPSVAPLNTTTYCVTVTDAVGCSASTCQSVVVNPPLFVDAGSDKTMTNCPNSTVIIGGSPSVTGGSGGYAYTWSPEIGLDSLFISNPHVHGLTASTIYTIHVVDRLTACGAYDQVLVTVLPSTLSVEAGPDKFVCWDNINGVQLGGIPTATGGQSPFIYEWTTLQGLSDSTVANPIALPLVSTTYHLNITDALGCSAKDSVRVSIVKPDTVRIIGLNSKYCVAAGNVFLTGSPAGGTFSGAGVTGNVFQPSSVGIGNWCITYSYTNPLTGCSNDTVMCVRVDSLPNLHITGFNSSYCRSDDPVTLAGVPAGGNFTGTGMNGDVFSPSTANSGDNFIVYSFSDTATGCSNSIQITINVKDIPSLTINVSYDSIFIGSSVTFTPSYSLDVYNIIWTNEAGNNIYSGLNSVTLTPAERTYCIMATAISSPNGCVARDTACIAVMDTALPCHFPNTITPNNDGVNEEFTISCNEDYPNADIRIYDRWGAEIYHSKGHYDNKWNGYNQQGTQLPDATYFYMYYFNDGSKRMKKGFIEVYK